MPGKFIKKLSQKAVNKVVPETEIACPETISPSRESGNVASVEPEPEPEPSKTMPTPQHKRELAPLALPSKPKKKRGKHSRSKLKAKRENKHAVMIQSKWRGHCTRKTIAERKADKELEHTMEPQEDNAEEEQLEVFKRVPFAYLRRVQFCVDGASGLPVSCTATRVSCRLIKQDRTPLSEAAESHSDPESPVCSPDYDLFMTWKVASLDPSYTLLCRVDTLDRVSLEPRTVGYAALKLCSLPDGTQPAPGVVKSAEPESDADESICLNAGRFRLPLLLGKLPDWCPLTEERLEDLPVLPDAFLTVRLFDGSVEEPPRDKSEASAEDENCDGSVANLLYGTYDNPKVANRLRKAGHPDIPLQQDLGADLRLGRALEGEEWRELRPLLLKWLLQVFPPVAEMRKTVNPNYSLRFKDSDDVGVLLGLDMLYNMPVVRPREIPPNSVVGYKTVVQYLRGTRATWPDDAPPEDNPRYILDDVSQNWDFASSTARCPVYTDDLKLISNMQLAANACVLLIVTRVDVTFTTDASYDLKMPFRQPHRSWWGLLPLRTRSPFYSPEGSRLEDRDFDGAFVNAGEDHAAVLLLCPCCAGNARSMC